jgi:hypothetical protein
MWQACQSEPRIAEANLIGILTQYLIGGFDYGALVFRERLSARFLHTLSDDQAMNLSHVPAHVGFRNA